MSDGTAIEWTHMPGFKPATWNPVRGCTRVSEGCRNCYAETMAARFSDPGQWGHGFATRETGRWTGKVELIESQLELPLKWRSPRCVFVNSTSDLFHEKLSQREIDRIFDVMGYCDQHVFLVLTKRPERMREVMCYDFRRHRPFFNYFVKYRGEVLQKERRHPASNIWIGVSVEDQATAKERIPILLDTPAALRFVSYEPALGPVDFNKILIPHGFVETRGGELPKIDWIIAGGESGRGARLANTKWFVDAMAQCASAGVPFFMKQLTSSFGRKVPFDEWPPLLQVRQFPEMPV